MPLLSRRGHEFLQEGIVWCGTLVALSSFYYLFIGNKAASSQGSYRLRVSDVYAVNVATPIKLSGNDGVNATAGGDSKQLR
jgi:hypothetical protein